MNKGAWAADRFIFRVTGPYALRFLGTAGAQGIRLARLHREKDGFTATAFGVDRAALYRIAAQGGWQLEVLGRRGPGRWLERLLDRPGLPAGMVLFCCLIRLLEGLVWTIDFGELEGEQQMRLRTLLVSCGVREGVFLDDDTLQTAQNEALRQSDLFGWISLNFARGRLWVETTDAEYQTVRQETLPAPLYAKTEGVIVAVEAESGFAAVEVGQQVAAGDLLVDAVRLDRSGEAVLQGASGRIVARVEKSYTTLQPYTWTGPVLTGAGDTVYQWFWPGWSDTAAEPPTENVLTIERWIPLRLGRICLPGCIRQTNWWQQREETIVYTAEQAQALARRSCRARLYEEFPDAVIESEQRNVSATEEGAMCTIRYVFCADIASAGDPAGTESQ